MPSVTTSYLQLLPLSPSHAMLATSSTINAVFEKKPNETKQKQPQRKTRWRQRSTADVKAPCQNIHVYQIIQNIIPITNKPHCELRGMWNVRVIVSFSKQNPDVCTSGFCDMIRLYFWLLWHTKKKYINIFITYNVQLTYICTYTCIYVYILLYSVYSSTL